MVPLFCFFGEMGWAKLSTYLAPKAQGGTKLVAVLSWHVKLNTNQ